MKTLLVLVLSLCACSSPQFPFGCPPVEDVDYGTRYAVEINMTTPDGIQVDTTGQNISGALIDRLTDEVETCLSQMGSLSKEAAEAAECHQRILTEVRRECFAVKVPDNWSWTNGEPRQQVLADKAPDQGCIDKGQCTANAPCDCHYRAAIQGRTLIATPSLYLYKDVLVRLTTGCDNPWATPELARCATPTTLPDSMGDHE